MSTRIKLVVLGGSALATPKLFEAMARASARAAYDAVLVGRDAERLELVAAVSRDLLSAFPGVDIQVTTAAGLEPALDGADYILNQIRVGGLEGRAFDETFPRQFGIPGEETVGPGGFSSSLRGIPVVLAICRLIERAAPDACVLNLTNPSSIIQSAMRRYSKVKVIGTCDSPISLMEMIARLLGVGLGELSFDLGGMHHFGWITAVRSAETGLDRLPEVLARLDELPKLGSDPELVRAIGAIPSTYMRYYFHPDRVLAASEGRPVRAQELMALGEQLLADYRRWHPGQPAGFLAARGAVWYEKIVAPALLALAERRDTELVLSVDNAGLLSWLPADAVIEAPVPIRSGVLQRPRPVELPLDVRALLHRNCAYEMLAAEAIAEHDRAKAQRALMANLMVSSHTQARGVLDLLWPR